MVEVVQMAEATIADETLRNWEDRIGLYLRVGNIFNSTVSYEAIRNYVNGIGDNNPLYRDENYAINTRYGKLIAPPNWLYSVFPTWVLQGLPGIQAFHSGNDWVFYRPIFLGDKITPKSKFMGFDVKTSKFSGKMVFEYQRAEFCNQREEVVAKTDLWVVRSERQTARKMGKYSSLQLPHPWTEKELEKIDNEVLDEEIRGANPRYWENVEVGEELHPLVKGPFGLIDMVAYTMGANPVGVAASATQLREYKKHPAWGFRDPETHAWMPIFGVHFSKVAANTVGIPYPYDGGAQRHSYLIQFLCSWMGDNGWLKRNYAEYRRFVYFSDVLWFRGKVVKKYIDEEGEYCVDIETHTFNQREEDTMPGYSVVALPSKNARTSPVERRISK